MNKSLNDILKIVGLFKQEKYLYYFVIFSAIKDDNLMSMVLA